MPNVIDQGGGVNLWAEQDQALYNKLDFYLAASSIPFFDQWQVWPKLLGKRRWTPNMGPIMKGVGKVFSPVLRSQFFPNAITSDPLKDVIEVKEVTEQALLRWHNFESQLIRFLGSFQDFLTNSIDFNLEDIVRKISIAGDLFYRTYVFHASPKIWVCGVGLVDSPYLHGTAMSQADGKSTAFLQAQVPTVSGMLSIKELFLLSTVMENDLGITFYKGDMGQQTDGGLTGKYCLVSNGEVWDNWQFDPFLLGNRSINLDVVTKQFRGSIGGRWTTLLERFPMRIAADGTIPAPETLELGTAAYNINDTVPLPAYVNAPVGVAFAVGSGSYDVLDVGPPPAPFSSGSLDEDTFSKMDWNGKVHKTRNFLLKKLDASGGTVLDTNKYGHYIQLISEVVYGIIANRRRNILPVLYRRGRVGTVV